MIEDLYKRIWKLSGNVGQRDAYTNLVSLTGELISLYDEQGRLSEDPFQPTRLRVLSLPDNMGELLKDRVCLITGGSGCVGSALLDELLQFGVKKIIVFDIAPLPAHRKD